MLPDILEETTSHKELAQTVVKMHEDLIVPLKKREDEAKIIMTEFKSLQAKYEKEKKVLEDSANSRIEWALSLKYIPAWCKFNCTSFVVISRSSRYGKSNCQTS